MSNSRVEGEFNLACDVFMSQIFSNFYDIKISKYQGVNFMKLKVKIYEYGILANGRAFFTVSVNSFFEVFIHDFSQNCHFCQKLGHSDSMSLK